MGSLATDSHTAANFASLTSNLTSLPLHSMSRQHPDHHIDSTIYRIAIQRKLRPPVLPPTMMTLTCPCGSPLDRDGDHFFSCRLASKTVLSNTIRDTTATLLRTLAPLAGFTHSATAVTRETAQLLPNALNHFPADGMPLEPSYLTRQSPHAARFLALDVTVPSPPSSARDAPLTAETATSQHHRAEREKFCGRYVSS